MEAVGAVGVAGAEAAVVGAVVGAVEEIGEAGVGVDVKGEDAGAVEEEVATGEMPVASFRCDVLLDHVAYVLSIFLR